MVANSTDRFNGVVASKAIKVPCVVATSANITLSGEQTIDSVAVTSGDRVLVRAQTDATENGIYCVDTSGWSRAADWDGNRDIERGTWVVCYDSSGNESTYIVSTANPIVIGTTAVTIDLFRQTAESLVEADGTVRANVPGTGILRVYSNGDTDTEARRIELAHADGTVRAEWGFTTTSDMNFIQRIHGGLIRIYAEDTGGVIREMIRAAGDNDVNLGQAGVFVARTALASAGGFEVNNTLDGGGFEQVTTQLKGSFTAASYSGFSSDPTWNWSYIKQGDVVHLSLDDDSTETGTSNSALHSFTGLPVDLRPTVSVRSCMGSGVDGGSQIATSMLVGTGGTVSMEIHDDSVWTSSGAKGFRAGATFTYVLQ